MRPLESIQEPITNETKKKSAKESYNPITKKWERNCPKCYQLLNYKNLCAFREANRTNTLCRCCVQSGKVASESTKIKMSIIKQGKIPFIMTNEIRNKISRSHIGKKWTQKSKDKLSKTITGKNNPNYGNGEKIKGKNNPFYGKSHSKETILKLRKSKLGIKWSKERKEKCRIHICSRMNTAGILSFNPWACVYIDALSLDTGLNFQHALNGGEKKFVVIE
jgi:hypothetical protein